MSRIVLIWIGCALLQVGILANTGLPVIPNLLLLVSVWILLYGQPKAAFWIAFMSGMLLDIYSQAAFGSFILSTIVVVVLLQWLVTSVLPKDENLLFVAIIVAIASSTNLLLSAFIDFGISYFTAKETLLVGSLFRLQTLYIIFANVIVYLPASFVFRKIMGKAYEDRSLRT